MIELTIRGELIKKVMVDYFISNNGITNLNKYLKKYLSFDFNTSFLIKDDFTLYKVYYLNDENKETVLDVTLINKLTIDTFVEKIK